MNNFQDYPDFFSQNHGSNSRTFSRFWKVNFKFPIYYKQSKNIVWIVSTGSSMNSKYGLKSLQTLLNGSIFNKFIFTFYHVIACWFFIFDKTLTYIVGSCMILLIQYIPVYQTYMIIFWVWLFESKIMPEDEIIHIAIPIQEATLSYNAMQLCVRFYSGQNGFGIDGRFSWDSYDALTGCWVVTKQHHLQPNTVTSTNNTQARHVIML